MLELRDVETPSPRPNEVLIKIAAAGVNRADLLQRQGHYQLPPGASTIPGLEVSGTIAEVGEEVSNWEVDDPCVALLAGGGYAEYVCGDCGHPFCFTDPASVARTGRADEPCAGAA